MNKILKILLIIPLILIIMSSNIYAEWGFFSGYKSSKGSAIDIDVSIGTTGAERSSDDMISRIVGIVQVIGSVIAVLALVIIGIRYMFSSVEEKAEMKGIMMYYIIGAILVFGTVNVVSLAYNVLKDLE